MKPFFRCLCVRAPFAGHIVDNLKPIEYRSAATRVRGTIGIIESGTGQIIGQVELYDCQPGEYEGCYNWYLRNGKRYKTPIPYRHPRGAIIWVKCPPLEHQPEFEQRPPPEVLPDSKPEDYLNMKK